MIMKLEFGTGIGKTLERFILSKMISRYRLGLSQFGEDRIVLKLAKKLGIDDIYFLDIGACDPIFGNNTFLFYCLGAHGVCVEANPQFCEEIRRFRPRDLCLNLGVCGKASAATQPFYVLPSRVLSSFSLNHVEATGQEHRQIDVEMISINELIHLHCDKTPNFISIDVEGMDKDIIENFDFDKYTPEIFCIETLKYNIGKQQKSNDIISFMLDNDYKIHADTYVNTIFVHNLAWSRANDPTTNTSVPA